MTGKYAFQLGTHAKLSLSELTAVLGEKNFIGNYDQIAIFSVPPKTDIIALQNRLGGTIKTMKILKTFPYPNSKSALMPVIFNALNEIMPNIFKNFTGKINFAVSFFGFKQQLINIKETLRNIKKFLKNSLNLNSRFINKGNKPVPSSSIHKAGVLKKGSDINIINCGKKIIIAVSVALQNIDAYSLRDYKKPVRDARIGMLPPKLAQIMINLAGEKQTIFDPFCGTGTVLMEGMLMNKSVIGSDINPDMYDASKQNCSWLEQKFSTKSSWRVFLKDAMNLNESDVPEKIDAIITETYLGPPQSYSSAIKEHEKIFKTLTFLHRIWLKKTNNILKENGKTVMCLPAFRFKKEIVSFPNFEKIAKKAGFKIIKSFLYSRHDQIVAREIIVLEKM